MVSRLARLPYKEFRARGYSGTTTSYFSVRARRNTLGKNRFGIIINTSLIKSAARRNFWRRQAKSTLLNVPQRGFDILVILRQRTAPPLKDVFRKMLSTAVISLISSL